jgi:hypothetical protein
MTLLSFRYCCHIYTLRPCTIYSNICYYDRRPLMHSVMAIRGGWGGGAAFRFGQATIRRRRCRIKCNHPFMGSSFPSSRTYESQLAFMIGARRRELNDNIINKKRAWLSSSYPQVRPRLTWRGIGRQKGQPHNAKGKHPKQTSWAQRVAVNCARAHETQAAKLKAVEYSGSCTFPYVTRPAAPEPLRWSGE